MIQQQAIVTTNEPLSSDCFRLTLSTDGGMSQAVPGQFVMVQVNRSPAPLLRRPFSIAGILGPDQGGPGTELLIKVVGEGTRMLSELRPGDTVDLLGPLGHGFRVNRADRRIYLAAGGIGVAPLRFLAYRLLSGGIEPDRCHLFLGGRSQDDLLCRHEFETMGIPVTVTTDDGSDGNQCLITDPLELAITDQAPDRVYACGPHGMLACVAGIVQRQKVPCQVSIETMMACGLGACLGCAVKGANPTDSYLHACINGPVFEACDIDLSD